jgi:microcystin-dependent protein
LATVTPNKGYLRPTVNGDVNLWGTMLNNDLTTIDSNLGGVASITVAGSANVVLTSAQAQNLILNLTGALTGNISVVTPALGGFYYVQNNSTGAFQITIITSATGSSGVSIPQGSSALVFSDGTNITFGSTTFIPPGHVDYFATITAPTGYLVSDGSAVSRTVYQNLFQAITSASVVTVTIASPAVITWTSHGRVAGDPVAFETTGALPTGLAVGTQYYVIAAGLTANTFEVSATVGGAAINTTGSQSGIQTCRYTPFGCGDGATTFNLPDLRGVVPRGWDDGRGLDPSRVFGSYQADIFASHTHTVNDPGHTHSINDPTHTHTATDFGHIHPSNQVNTLISGSFQGYTSGQNVGALNSNVGNANIGVSSSITGITINTSITGISVSNTGGTETRGKNVALLGCVKI